MFPVSGTGLKLITSRSRFHFQKRLCRIPHRISVTINLWKRPVSFGRVWAESGKGQSVEIKRLRSHFCE